MDSLVRWHFAFPPAPAWMRSDRTLRALRHACVVVLVAAPVLGTCPTLQHAFDRSLYASALDLVQASLRDDDPWQARASAVMIDAADGASLPDDAPRPVAMHERTRVHADVMELLTFATPHEAAGATTTDDGDRDVRHRGGALPSAGMRSAMPATDVARAGDEALFRMPPDSPVRLGRPPSVYAGLLVTIDEGASGMPVVPPPGIVPIDVSSFMSTEALLTSVPPVVPPTPGVPPVTVIANNGPSTAAPPPSQAPSGGIAYPPGGVPPGEGSGVNPGNEVVRPPLRPLPEPGSAWLVALAIALVASTSWRPALRRCRAR